MQEEQMNLSSDYYYMRALVKETIFHLTAIQKLI